MKFSERKLREAEFAEANEHRSNIPFAKFRRKASIFGKK